MDFHVLNLPDQNLIRVHKSLTGPHFLVGFRMALQLLDSGQCPDLFLFRNCKETINGNPFQTLKREHFQTFRVGCVLRAELVHYHLACDDYCGFWVAEVKPVIHSGGQGHFEEVDYDLIVS